MVEKMLSVQAQPSDLTQPLQATVFLDEIGRFDERGAEISAQKDGRPSLAEGRP